MGHSLIGRVAAWACCLLLAGWMIAGCQKVELPSDDDTSLEGGHTSDGSGGELDLPDVPYEPGYEGELSVLEYISLYNDVNIDINDYKAVVKGYVVGACRNSLKNTYFTGEEISEQRIASNVLLADSKDERNAARCVPLELPEGRVRDALSLLSNPGNLGREICVTALVKPYFGVVGLRDVDDFYWVDDAGGDASDPDEPQTPETPDEPDDTEPDLPDVPYEPGYTGELSVWEYISLYNGVNVDSTSYVTVVTGYVVGACKNSIANTYFTSEEISAQRIASNVLLADSKDERDVSRCVPMELPSGSLLRKAVNLIDNPGNLGRKICVLAMAKTYFRVVGLREVDEFKWVDDDGGGTSDPDEPQIPDVPDDPEDVDPDVPEPPLDVKDTLAIDTTPEVVPGGRSVSK